MLLSAKLTVFIRWLSITFAVNFICESTENSPVDGLFLSITFKKNA